MKALVDGDIIPYEFASAKDGDGVELSAPLTLARVDQRIETILEKSGSDTYQIFLTGEGNFRKRLATILPYKGHRPTDKGRWWKVIRHHLIHNWKAEVVDGIEADDAMSIEQYAENAVNLENGECMGGSTVICSRDKDLNMVPGYHYGWEAGLCKEKPVWFQDDLGGLKLFYQQMLTGDKTDNILGLFRVGAKAECVKRIAKMDNELDMYVSVFKEYQDRFGAYAEKFLIENARLLFMLKERDIMWEPIITINQLQEMHGDWVIDPV